MKKSNRKHRVFKYGIVLVVFIFFVLEVFGLYGNFSDAGETYLVEYGSIVQENEYDCLVVRDETLIYPTESGHVDYKVNEGDKIRKGYRLYEMGMQAYSEGGMTDGSVDIKDLQDYLRTSMDTLDVQRQVEDIRKLSASGDYGKIVLIKHAIDDKIKQTGKANPSGEQEEKYRSAYAPFSGIVSFHIDGYEEILDKGKIKSLDMGKILEEAIVSEYVRNSKADPSAPLMKIIDNTVWHVYVYTDLRNISRFDIGAKVKIVFEEEDVDAVVIEINNEIGNCYTVLRVNQQAKALSGSRKTRLHIVNKNIKGLIAPVDALVYQGEEIGVLIRNLNGKAVFKPVEVKGRNDEWCILSDRVFYRNDAEGNSTPIDTVKVYDEIIVDVSK